VFIRAEEEEEEEKDDNDEDDDDEEGEEGQISVGRVINPRAWAESLMRGKMVHLMGAMSGENRNTVFCSSSARV
jgi:hypothetical protein